MDPIEELVSQDTFLKTLFDSIPCGVLVVDDDRRVHTVNRVMEQAFGVSKEAALNRRGGEALHCVHSSETPEGCGYSESCSVCEVKQAAVEALRGSSVYRRKARVELMVDDLVEQKNILVSAAPLAYEDETFAVIMIEDITELTILRERLQTEQSFRGIIGRNRKIRELFDVIRETAEVDAPILIEGETGTGKELVAAAIHNEGPRKNKLFVPVNCGALPEGLLESELFGHVKGAFTGAIRDKKGRFELADGGTIFLDEIGDITPAMQVKILRVLQEGTFEPVGSERTKKVNVRVISATNKNLRDEMSEGNFREDLYYRINVVPVRIPPLRERRNDIPLLAEYFLERVLNETGRSGVTVSAAALDAMVAYSWPGNVRELQNWIQFATIKCRDDEILPEHLPPSAYQVGTFPRRQDQDLFTVRKKHSRKLNREMVKEALRTAEGNKAEAARVLGVGRATLYRFLKDIGI